MNFVPHGYCLAWDRRLLALHILSDLTIGTAYLTMPVALIWLAAKRQDLPFRIIVMFTGVFVCSCGVGHFMSVVVLWVPEYWAQGWIKLITAIASIGTAFAMAYALPRALEFPSADQFEDVTRALAHETTERLRVQAVLQQHVVYIKGYRPVLIRQQHDAVDEIAFAARFRLIGGAPVLDAVMCAHREDQVQDL